MLYGQRLVNPLIVAQGVLVRLVAAVVLLDAVQLGAVLALDVAGGVPFFAVFVRLAASDGQDLIVLALRRVGHCVAVGTRRTPPR